MSDNTLEIRRRETILDQAITVGVTSTIVNLNAIEGYAIQATWSGGASFTGTLSLESSLDSVNFVEVPNSSQAITGATGTHLWNAVDQHYEFVRAKLVVTTGTATNMKMMYIGKSRE